MILQNRHISKQQQSLDTMVTFRVTSRHEHSPIIPYFNQTMSAPKGKRTECPACGLKECATKRLILTAQEDDRRFAEWQRKRKRSGRA